MGFNSSEIPSPVQLGESSSLSWWIFTAAAGSRHSYFCLYLEDTVTTSADLLWRFKQGERRARTISYRRWCHQPYKDNHVQEMKEVKMRGQRQCFSGHLQERQFTMTLWFRYTIPITPIFNSFLCPTRNVKKFQHTENPVYLRPLRGDPVRQSQSISISNKNKSQMPFSQASSQTQASAPGTTKNSRITPATPFHSFCILKCFSFAKGRRFSIEGRAIVKSKDNI